MSHPIHMCPQRGRHEETRIPPNRFPASISEDSLRRRTPFCNSKLGIPFDDGERGMLEVNAQLLLGLAKLLFRAFAVSNIAANTEQADDLAIGIAVRPLR